MPVGAHLLDRLRSMPPWQLDVVLAAAFVVTGLATTGRTDPGYQPRDGWAVALILLATAPYVARRRAPLPVFLVTMTATAALYVEGYGAGGLPFVVGAGAYSVAAHRPRTEVAVAAAYMYAAFVVMVLADNPGFGVGEFATSVPLFAAALFVGWTMQQRRLRYDELARSQSAASLQAAADERLRIAQELHDVIGHSLGVIAVQAGAGMLVIDSDVAKAKQAFEHIARTSRSSLAEIRMLLGLVRSGEAATDLAPTPGLADLPRLVDEVRDSGLVVELAVESSATDLPPGVELAAYRIAQEALTNVVRHARARRATVCVRAAHGTLRVVVTDDGAGVTGRPRTGGHGLVGMQERVAVYGGTLEAGPSPDGGFRIAAALPYERGVRS